MRKHFQQTKVKNDSGESLLGLTWQTTELWKVRFFNSETTAVKNSIQIDVLINLLQN